MITLRRAGDRHHERCRSQDVWLTFCPQDQADPLANGFGILEGLDEDRVPPGALARHPLRDDAEIITYVREGAVAYDGDSRGGSRVIQAGEFERATTGGGARHGQSNPSRTEWAHVFQIRLPSPAAGLEPGREQRRFSAAERRGRLCVVASSDGRRGSLRVHQDAVMCSAILDRGQHVVHELAHGRSAWLHLVQGEVTLGDLVLATGDGAGVTAERAVSLTARGKTEILLLDLGNRRRPSPITPQSR
jgi:redox-sensitive bicupin YhaK (pirin superfamily)